MEIVEQDKLEIIKALKILNNLDQDTLYIDVIKTYYTIFDLEDVIIAIENAIIKEEEVQTSDY